MICMNFLPAVGATRGTVRARVHYSRWPAMLNAIAPDGLQPICIVRVQGKFP